MRAIVQRVSRAAVTVEGQVVGRIEHGLLVYVAVACDDEPGDADYLAKKIRYLRIFKDAADKMNLDVTRAGGAVLVVSNFTLMADVHQGRRPAFTGAASGTAASDLYGRLCDGLRGWGLAVETGRFGALMSVDATGDGPVNILVDSKRRF